MTACAGVLCEAERRRSTRAVLLVHEFVTDRTDDRKHDENGRDLDLFLARLSHRTRAIVSAGTLYGPFSVPGLPLVSPEIRLYVGKAIRDLRA
jgi:hypothetical protein